LGVTHLIADYFGDEVTTPQLQVGLLHDTVEDGRINREPVTPDIIEGEFGKLVTDGVVAMTNHDGNAERYYRDLSVADERYPELELITIKVLDRMINLLDPSTGELSPKAKEKRRRKIQDTKERFIPLLLTNPKYQPLEEALERCLQLSEATITIPDFVPTKWAANVKQRSG